MCNNDESCLFSPCEETRMEVSRREKQTTIILVPDMDTYMKVRTFSISYLFSFIVYGVLYIFEEVMDYDEFKISRNHGYFLLVLLCLSLVVSYHYV